MLESMFYGLFRSTDLQTFLEALSIFLIITIFGWWTRQQLKSIEQSKYFNDIVEEAKKNSSGGKVEDSINLEKSNTTDTPHAPVDADTTGEISDSTQGDNKT